MSGPNGPGRWVSNAARRDPLDTGIVSPKRIAPRALPSMESPPSSLPGTVPGTTSAAWASSGANPHGLRPLRCMGRARLEPWDLLEVKIIVEAAAGTGSVEFPLANVTTTAGN